MIYLKKSEIHGRGVFANKNIHKEELIEKIPYIEFNREDQIEDFKKYSFGLTNGKLCVMTSYSSFLNHSEEPNAVIKNNKNDEYLYLYSLRDIDKDEEITICYSKDVKF